MRFIQERITQYIEFKGITPYRFCKDLGFSIGYLDKRGAIGTDKYLKIIEYYNDLNPEWLLAEKGEMLRSAVESKMVSKEESSSFKEQLDDKNEIITLLKEKIGKLEKEVVKLKKEKETPANNLYVAEPIPELKEESKTNSDEH